MRGEERDPVRKAAEELLIDSAGLPERDLLRQLRLETYAPLHDMSRHLPLFVRRCRAGLEHLDDPLRDLLLGDRPAEEEPLHLDASRLATAHELVRVSSPIWTAFLLAGRGEEQTRDFVRETFFESEWVSEASLDRLIDHVLDMLSPESAVPPAARHRRNGRSPSLEGLLGFPRNAYSTSPEYAARRCPAAGLPVFALKDDTEATWRYRVSIGGEAGIDS